MSVALLLVKGLGVANIVAMFYLCFAVMKSPANPKLPYLTTGERKPVEDLRNVRPNPHLQFPLGIRVEYRYELQQIVEAVDKSKEASAQFPIFHNLPEVDGKWHKLACYKLLHHPQ